ncbi:hypothetical protein ACFX2J_014752 [Malus domestica]
MSNNQVACRQIDMGLGILVTFLRTVADSSARDPKPLVSPPIPPCEHKWVRFKSLGGCIDNWVGFNSLDLQSDGRCRLGAFSARHQRKSFDLMRLP